RPLLTDRAEDVQKAEKIILPGVGAFETGINHLNNKGLSTVLRDASEGGRHILGICLGMQLLMSESEELGRWKGLDVIPGKVVNFDPPGPGERFKIPHMGWNSLYPCPSNAGGSAGTWKGTVLDGVREDSCMYFIHSLCVRSDDPGHSLAMTDYGRNSFSSVVRKKNTIGCQFHPERSSIDGIRVLENFLLMK
ncbi:MAG: imidazole glycerol phosphate synthase subunit HisH, partial [Thermodesulfobacteriota bacterium]